MVTEAETVDLLQRSQKTTASDAEFTKLLDVKTRDVYMAGSATQLVYRTLGTVDLGHPLTAWAASVAPDPAIAAPALL